MSVIRSIVLVAGCALALAPHTRADASASVPAGFSEIIDTARYQAPNGQWFSIVKGIRNGEPTTIYTNVLTGQQFDLEQLADWQNANPPARVDDALSAAALLSPDRAFTVVIRLGTNPWRAEMQRLRAEVEPKLEPLRRAIQDMHRSLRPAESMDTEAERAWFDQHKIGLARLTIQQQLQIEQLSEQIETIENGVRMQVRRNVLPLIAADQDA
ncbi:MAG: hypothetical protein K2W85_10610, partial [Phycisphaerales bacterium]|nr:hypothetical protein [Phycisphaerales bacterium]